jgi:protein-S-isoprenylcysteine O-methyltransferase Ste14
MTATTDTPGVIAPPPLLYAGALAAALVVHWVWPLRILDTMTPWLGLAVLALGLAIAIAGRRAMRAAATNVNPYRPSTAIVSSGPFRFTRNPLYVGLTLLYVGLTLAFNTWWGLILLPAILVVMHFGVVLREERYLEMKFGERYRQYRSTVRRYF